MLYLILALLVAGFACSAFGLGALSGPLFLLALGAALVALVAS